MRFILELATFLFIIWICSVILQWIEDKIFGLFQPTYKRVGNPFHVKYTHPSPYSAWIQKVVNVNDPTDEEEIDVTDEVRK